MYRTLIRDLRKNTKSFINTIGRVDIDLTIRSNLIEFIYSKYGKTPSDKTVESVEMLDEDEFIYCIKIFWLIGKWIYDIDSDFSIYDLFKSTIKSVRDMLDIYFNLLEIYPYYVIEASFITFLQRAVDLEEQDVSASYMRLLKQFNDKSGNKIKGSIMQYCQKDKVLDDMRFIGLLLDLR